MAAPPLFPEPLSLPAPERMVLDTVPRPRFPVAVVTMITAGALVAGFLFSAAPDPAIKSAQRVLAGMVLVAAFGVTVLAGSMHRRRLADEETAVSGVEEMLRLRRHADATAVLAPLVSGAMLDPLSRARALFAATGILLARRRHDDCERLASALLSEGVPGAMVAPLRAARASALLRDDRLVDADRALGDLRKLGRDGTAGALLALTESHRELRTGHADDLLAAYADRRRLVAQVMGTKVAYLDALAAAAAFDRGDPDTARRRFARATSVLPLPVILDAYPELSRLTADLPATTVPVELTGRPA